MWEWPIEKGGIVVVLGLAVWGFLRRWWVPGWTYERAVVDRDKAIRDRDEQTTMAQQAVMALAKLTDLLKIQRARARDRRTRS